LSRSINKHAYQDSAHLAKRFQRRRFLKISIEITAFGIQISIFKQDAFDNFINDISSSKTMPLLNYQDFKESFMADKLQSLLFVQDGGQ
jgi:hypothetical protein